jgi:hypothetical protein
MTARFTDIDAEYGFPTGLLDSTWRKESTRGTDWVSPAGAVGHFQFMPRTRREMIQKHGLDPWSKDERIAARCCALYLKELTDQFDGDLEKGLSAYNAGAGNVRKAIRKHGDNWLHGLRAETQAYAANILGHLDGHENTRSIAKKSKTRSHHSASRDDEDETPNSAPHVDDKMNDHVGLGEVILILVAALIGGGKKDDHQGVAVNYNGITTPNVPNKKPGNTVTSPTLYS